MRTLVLGGTGVFGGRLCRLLADDPLIERTAGARMAPRSGPRSIVAPWGQPTSKCRRPADAGMPLPRFCWPIIKAVETGEEGRFRFDVEIGLPVIGRLIRYRGTLTSR